MMTKAEARVPDILIIGCGAIAGGYDQKAGRTSESIMSQHALTHAGAYRKAGLTPAACVDPTDSIRQDFMAFWGVKSGFRACSDIPVDARYDIVSICTPASLHLTSVKEALAFSPSVIFMEKPLASDLDEAAEIIDLCKAADVRLVVNISRRWDSVLQQFIDDIRSGKWGELRRVVGVYGKGLKNNGSHMLEIIHRLTGKVVIENAIVRGYSQDKADPDIEVTAISESNVRVNLLPGDSQDFTQFECRITTSEAEITMCDGGLRWEVRRAAPHPAYPGYRMLDSAEHITGGYLPVMENAIKMVVQGDIESDGSAQAAFEVQRLCEEIFRKTL